MAETLSEAPEAAPQEPVESFLTHYLVVPEVFSPQECRRIVYANLPATQAHVSVFEGDTENQLQLHHRNTKVKSFPRTHEYTWIYERLFEKIKLVNNLYFHFQIRNVTDLQLLEYENTGFYGTHVDIGTGQTSKRKFSMVSFLTPQDEYEGGELILKPHFTAFEQVQGSAVFFPSYVPHEIKPVTQGVRHTLVTWILGPHYV